MTWQNWRPGELLSLQYKADAYSVAELGKRPLMRFYGLSCSTPEWENLDLTSCPLICEVYVGRIVLQNLQATYIDGATATKPIREFEQLMIRARLKPRSDGGFPFQGGDLVDLGPGHAHSSTRAPVLKADLSVAQDRRLIEQYELTGVWGDKLIRDRLRAYFEGGRVFDPQKLKVFPALGNDADLK